MWLRGPGRGGMYGYGVGLADPGLEGLHRWQARGMAGLRMRKPRGEMIAQIQLQGPFPRRFFRPGAAGKEQRTLPEAAWALQAPGLSRPTSDAIFGR